MWQSFGKIEIRIVLRNNGEIGEIKLTRNIDLLTWPIEKYLTLLHFQSIKGELTKQHFLQNSIQSIFGIQIKEIILQLFAFFFYLSSFYHRSIISIQFTAKRSFYFRVFMCRPQPSFYSVVHFIRPRTILPYGVSLKCHFVRLLFNYSC